MRLLGSGHGEDLDAAGDPNRRISWSDADFMKQLRTMTHTPVEPHTEVQQYLHR